MPKLYLTLAFVLALPCMGNNMPHAINTPTNDSIKTRTTALDDEECASPLQTILPLSPQAAALARYGEYPVSMATGVPDINIPIYTIRLGDFSLPIRLAYHSSGIRVDDVASIVGLGWSLDPTLTLQGNFKEFFFLLGV